MIENRAPLVSVVLAVYNAEEYIDAAVSSILQQTFDDFELIIIDDASTDGTTGILSQFTDPRIIILHNESNTGPYKAANRGISTARGEIIARHDADDISLPDRFAQQVEALRKNPNLVLVGSSYYIIDRTGQIIDITNLPSTNEELQNRLEYGNIFIQGATMFRKSAFDKVGGYREFFPVTQDYDLFLRLAELGNIANLESLLYKFRFHGESISRKKKELQLACRRLAWELAQQRRSGQEEGQIPENIFELYPPEPARLFHEARGTAYLYYAAGQYQKANEAIERAKTYISDLDDINPSWEDWTLAHANLYAELCNDWHIGEKFIRWIMDQIKDYVSVSTSNDLLSKYYSAQAFRSYWGNLKGEVPGLVLSALRSNINTLKNRGLLSIAMKSMLGISPQK